MNNVSKSVASLWQHYTIFRMWLQRQGWIAATDTLYPVNLSGSIQCKTPLKYKTKNQSQTEHKITTNVFFTLKYFDMKISLILDLSFVLNS